MTSIRGRALLATGALALAAGCRVNPATPLSLAVVSGEVGTVRALSATPGAAGQFGDEGMTPLHWAARTGQTESLRILVEAGAPLDVQDRRATEWTPLMHAVHKGQAEAVSVLLELGARPDASGEGRVTALMMAAGYGQATMVRALLAAGADPRARSASGVNALWAAAGGASFADPLDGPAFGSCQPETIALLRQAAPDLRIAASLSASLLEAFSRSEECSRLLEDLIER